MIQRVKNNLQVTCNDVDFTTSTNIEFYLRQDAVFKSYTPTVVSAHLMTVQLPKSDMVTLKDTFAELQFALTDADNQPVISEIMVVPVMELLKESGYGN